MQDLRSELSNVWRTANALKPRQHGGRTLMFTAARSGEGVSSVAASFALIAAQGTARPSWLIDLDLARNHQFRAFQKGFARGVGRPGRGFDGSLHTNAFCQFLPAPVGHPQKTVTIHPIIGTRLWVTRCRTETLRKGQRIHLTPHTDWWARVRQAGAWAIIDGPALSRSSAALKLARQADGVVIVAETDVTTPEEIIATRRAIEAQGGRVIGVTMNRVPADIKHAVTMRKYA